VLGERSAARLHSFDFFESDFGSAEPRSVFEGEEVHRQA
jgi:hypothetical protein